MIALVRRNRPRSHEPAPHRSEERSSGPRLAPRSWVDLAVHTLLSLIGIVGLATSFHDLGWLLAGLGGLVVGTASALVARALRLGALLTAGLALVAYLVFGSALAVPEQAVGHVIPSVTSIASLGIGAVWGWADLITLRPPVELPDYVTVVPYVSAWLVGLVGATLATRWLPRRRTAPRAALLLIGPALLYLASILLGTEQPYHPGVRGVVFAAVALVWLGWRHSTVEHVKVERSDGMLRRRITGTAVVVGGAVVVGAVVGSALVPVADTRFVLRDQIVPPFEQLEFSSPLAGFRQYSKLEVDKALFTVKGLKTDELVRLATMDSYDGHLWTVAGSTVQTDGSGSFALVGGTYPRPDLVTSGGTQTLAVTIRGYSDVWIPSVGYPTSLSLAKADRDELAGLRYNAATGSAVLLDGLHRGDTITLTAELQKTDYDDSALADVPTAHVKVGAADDIPDVVAAKATEFAGDTTSPIKQLRNIEQTLHTTGFLSHGTASDSVASLAGHGADRMESLFNGSAMVGDAEQYASAMALMARSLGYPARVVMGFAPTVSEDAAASGSAVKVTGHDVTAWVEVAFEGVGWVPFLPTPTQTDVPQDQVPKPQTEPQPQVRQPPRSQQDENDLVGNVSIDNSKKKTDKAFELPGWAIATALGVGIPAVIVLGPLLVIAAVKRRRARRRRRVARGQDAAAGAWDELLDRVDELGIVPPPPTTRGRTARVLSPQLAALTPASVTSAVPSVEVSAAGGGVMGEDTLTALARRTDDAVFSGREPSDDEVDAVWAEAIATVDAARDRLPRWRRVRARYRLASLVAWSRRVAKLAGARTRGGGRS